MNGDALRTQGDLDQALSYYQKGESVIKQLAETAPSNAGWQRDVSVSYDKIGDVLMAEGHWAKALDNYRSALAIRQRLVIADPSNTEWQNDLIYSYCRLAEEAESSGTGGAIEWWRKAYAGLSAVHQNGTMRQSDQVELERLRKKVEMP
jgi:tetratricopeptide (TPR) repeat protein